MGTFLTNAWTWVQGNGALMAAGGFTVGLASANYALLIQKFVKSKWVTAAIRKDPALAKAIVAELQKDVDAVADAAPSAAPAPADAPKSAA
jgi:hypothetical protein